MIQSWIHIIKLKLLLGESDMAVHLSILHFPLKALYNEASKKKRVNPILPAIEAHLMVMANY